MSVVRVFLHEAEAAKRFRMTAFALRGLADADGVSFDCWSAAQVAWEQIVGEPVADDVLRLALALGAFPEREASEQ